MKKLQTYIVDAFTDRPFSGNPAGVVIGAEDLTVTEMQSIAKEINLSETAFITIADELTGHFRIRYFTPTLEIDFCGHATIASAWVIYKSGLNHSVQPISFVTNIGIIPIASEYEGQNLQRVIMTQVAPQLKKVEEDVDELCNLVGIPMADIDNKYPIMQSYTGNWHLLIPIKTKEAIDNAKPDFDKLALHNQSHKISTTHLFTFNTENGNFLLYTRDFAPSSGVMEDPVTGSANGALAGYLALSKIVNLTDYHIQQGNSKNRPGDLFISVCQNVNEIRIQVGGSAVIMIEGLFML